MELVFGGRRSNISGSIFKRYMCREIVLLGFVTK